MYRIISYQPPAGESEKLNEKNGTDTDNPLSPIEAPICNAGPALAAAATLTPAIFTPRLAWTEPAGLKLAPNPSE
jgi:hypothetical protein